MLHPVQMWTEHSKNVVDCLFGHSFNFELLFLLFRCEFGWNAENRNTFVYLLLLFLWMNEMKHGRKLSKDIVDEHWISRMLFCLFTQSIVCVCACFFVVVVLSSILNSNMYGIGARWCHCLHCVNYLLYWHFNGIVCMFLFVAVFLHHFLWFFAHSHSLHPTIIKNKYCALVHCFSCGHPFICICQLCDSTQCARFCSFGKTKWVYAHGVKSTDYGLGCTRMQCIQQLQLQHFESVGCSFGSQKKRRKIKQKSHNRLTSQFGILWCLAKQLLLIPRTSILRIAIVSHLISLKSFYGSELITGQSEGCFS